MLIFLLILLMTVFGALKGPTGVNPPTGKQFFVS